jgi:hypothetical protein
MLRVEWVSSMEFRIDARNYNEECLGVKSSSDFTVNVDLRALLKTAPATTRGAVVALLNGEPARKECDGLGADAERFAGVVAGDPLLLAGDCRRLQLENAKRKKERDELLGWNQHADQVLRDEGIAQHDPLVDIAARIALLAYYRNQLQEDNVRLEREKANAEQEKAGVEQELAELRAAIAALIEKGG